MSSAEDLEQLVHDGFDAFNRGDLEGILAILDPEVECHVSPPLANAGTWHGHAGFATMVAGWLDAFESQRNTVVSVRHPDEHTAIAEVHQAAIGAGSGAPVEMTASYLFEVRGGLTVRMHLYPDVNAALAAVR